jgi:hypothetical protein
MRSDYSLYDISTTIFKQFNTVHLRSRGLQEREPRVHIYASDVQGLSLVLLFVNVTENTERLPARPIFRASFDERDAVGYTCLLPRISRPASETRIGAAHVGVRRSRTSLSSFVSS